MHDSTFAPRERVLAVLDDTLDAARVIEWSASLALTLRRDLGIVYVQSTAALVAASLPFTQVLEPAGAEWAPFAPLDVERGYRAQAELLRSLAERTAQRHDLSWSLRTMRGALPQLVFDAFAESDLLFLGPLPALRLAPPGGLTRNLKQRLQLAVASDGSEAGAQVVALAQRLADALSGSLHVIRISPDGPASAGALQSGAAHADLLVLPRALASLGNLARLSCPTLLVAQFVSNAAPARPAG
jgi:hypothetical protein